MRGCHRRRRHARVGEAVRELTGGLGVDAAIECSGSAAALDACIQATRSLGTVAQTGLHVRPAPIEGMLTVTYGGGGEETRIICGYMESSEFLFTPVFRTLPHMLVEQTGDGKVGSQRSQRRWRCELPTMRTGQRSGGKRAGART